MATRRSGPAKPSRKSSGSRKALAPPGSSPVPVDDSLDALRDAAAGCKRCDLWKPATQTVFGAGPDNARVLIVGEQPGDAEDVAGLPFVGPAGRMLDRALEELGLDRRRMYVTNAVKHFNSNDAERCGCIAAPIPANNVRAACGWRANLHASSRMSSCAWVRSRRATCSGRNSD
jgi:uracil-DNA glycosylase